MTKRIITFFLLLNLIIPNSILAQEIATPSAELEQATVSAELFTEASPSATLVEVFIQDPAEPSPELLPLLLPETKTQAQIKPATLIRKLSKSSYSSKEKISLVVSSGTAQDTQIKIFNPDGVEVSALLETIHEQNPAVITLTMPAQFKSGRYRAVITASDGTTSTQDFLWGVLAINPDQSVYIPNSTANFALAVLDETGNMVCDANVTLLIQTPEGISQAVPVTVSPACYIKDFTLTPDYSATYLLGSSGTYKLTLTANTQNGTYSISDSIQVVDQPDFIIKRTSATRIFPPKTYPMLMDITFNASFSGQIVESVPAVFAISPHIGSQTYDSIELATPSTLTRVLNIPELHLPFDGVFPISQIFGSPPDDQLLSQKYEAYGVVGHDGTDFAAPIGTPVLAIDDGEIIAADTNGTYGQTVVIEHSWGNSYYGHLSLITTAVGSKILKGHPLGMSGNSGLSTGPHLHLGIKPINSDPDNGYYGKVNPLPYLGTITTENGFTYTTGYPGDSNSMTKLIWNITAQAGDKITLGYNYQVPNISPQFYLVGPLQIGNYQEPRQWQLAIDADGSGTNTVNINQGLPSTTGNTYTYTFTASETMDTGGIQLTVPSGWSAPQGTVGTAGYTQASSTGTIGVLLDNAESISGWANSSLCTDAFALDSTIKYQGTYSIMCDTAIESSGDFFYKNISSSNWTNYTTVGFWIYASASISDGSFHFGYDDTAAMASPIITLNVGPIATTTWEWHTVTLTGTRNAILSYGFLNQSPNQLNKKIVYIDYLLIGQSSGSLTPTFAGTGPWTIDIQCLTCATSNTITVTYGSGGGTSGVTNPTAEDTYVFTTKSRTTGSGSLTNISDHPFVTIVGPNSFMRHQKWYNSSGVRQPFLL